MTPQEIRDAIGTGSARVIVVFRPWLTLENLLNQLPPGSYSDAETLYTIGETTTARLTVRADAIDPLALAVDAVQLDQIATTQTPVTSQPGTITTTTTTTTAGSWAPWVLGGVAILALLRR